MTHLSSLPLFVIAAFGLAGIDALHAAKPPTTPHWTSPQIAKAGSRQPQRSVGSAGRGTDAGRSASHRAPSHAFTYGMRIYPYLEGSLYPVQTAPGRVTDVVLEPGETLVAVASGDTARWVIGDTSSGSGASRRTHILVKPFSSGLATNLVITTDRRTYHLTLASDGRAPITALSWTYAQDELIALRSAQATLAIGAPVASAIAIEKLRFNYAISGDSPAWRPLRAFDDGRQTFIEFPATLAVGEAPPLFLVDRKGEAQLVNYRMRGNYYVVDRLFDVAELRLGTRRQEIVKIRRVSNKRGRGRS